MTNRIHTLTQTLCAGLAFAAAGTAAAPARAQQAGGGELEVTKVVLYKHGVGYFEREGKIEGTATLPLAFKTSQMPDVLKSLFAVHTAGRGRIESIVYDSKDPLSKQLADIMVDVPDGSALTAFLRRLKGAAVEITVGAQTTRGHVMGIEPIIEQSDDGTVTRYKCVLLGEDDVIRPVDLLDASGLRLLEPELQRDLVRMMEIYAKARHADRKTVSLRSVGGGPRTLRVGYIIEQPIWKTTYRLIFDQGEQPLLQGWAIVENRTDEDWNNVAMSFVAGSPLSFKMDLYTSYYPTRPVVGVQTASGGNVFGKLQEAERKLRSAAKGARPARKPMAPGAPSGRARFADGFANEPAADAKAENENLGRMLAASLAPAAAGAEAGELFSYNSKGTVSIKRGQAALVPILLETVEGGERILYYRADLSRHPQHAFRLKNSSNLTLEKGPVTVFEGSTCQGESLLTKVLKPGMHAVLPYAIETAVAVESKSTGRNQPVTRAVLVRGILTQFYDSVHETTYTVREKAGSARVIYLDHPRAAAHELVAPAKAAETLPGHHRFKVSLPANGTATLVVRERRELQSRVTIRDVNLQQLEYYLAQPYLSTGAAEVLGKARGTLAQLARLDATQRENRRKRGQLASDHERIRRTLGSFRGGGSERAMREKYLQRLMGIDDEIDTLDADHRTNAAEQTRLHATLAELLQAYAE
ncbi:MAG: hypothetical protein ACYTGX_04625 [Planctomycetota bacterium]|jgi:hypothetical protein